MRSYAIVSCSVALGMVFGFPVLSRAEGGDDVDAARAAALASEANFESIRTYKCRYIITKANAASADQALRGNYTNAQKCEFSLAVDREKTKLETVTRLDTTPPKNKQEIVNPNNGEKVKVYSTPFIPLGELRNGETSLSYARQWRQAQIIKQRTDLAGETPFEELYWRPSGGLKSWRNAVEQGRGRISSGGQTIEKGRAVIGLQYNLDSLEVSLRFDPSQGYLPVHIVLKSLTGGGRAHENHTVLLEAKEVGKGRWFPMHVVSFSAPEAEGQSLHIRDLHVTEITVDKVTDADLALQVSAGTTIFRQDMPVGSGEYITLQQDEKIGPADIAKIEATCKEAGSRGAGDRTVKLSKNRRNWKWYSLGAGLVLMVLTAVLYRRYRRRSA